MSFITLKQIKLKYPNANYAPNISCKKCSGTGEVNPRPVIVIDNDGSHVEWRDEYMGCICIYIMHEFCDLVFDGLKELAERELQDLGM